MVASHVPRRHRPAGARFCVVRIVVTYPPECLSGEFCMPRPAVKFSFSHRPSLAPPAANSRGRFANLPNPSARAALTSSPDAVVPGSSIPPCPTHLPGRVATDRLAQIRRLPFQPIGLPAQTPGLAQERLHRPRQRRGTRSDRLRHGFGSRFGHHGGKNGRQRRFGRMARSIPGKLATSRFPRHRPAHRRKSSTSRLLSRECVQADLRAAGFPGIFSSPCPLSPANRLPKGHLTQAPR